MLVSSTVECESCHFGLIGPQAHSVRIHLQNYQPVADPGVDPHGAKKPPFWVVPST